MSFQVIPYDDTFEISSNQFGSWFVGPTTANGGMYAATINESRAILGQYCFSDTGDCMWLLGNDIDCEEGIETPALVNTDGAALSLTVSCSKVDGKPRYVFNQFDTINEAVTATSRLAIAFPLKSGMFQVNRFSLNGATRAISQMRRATEKAHAKRVKGTTDLRF